MSAAEQFALTIVRRLQEKGHVAFFAGGCVRDRLMGLPPKDFDVATSATPDAVLALFPRSQQVGAAFGVVLVRGKPAGPPPPAAAGAPREAPPQVEVATFRADGTYSDGRHPDSVRFTTPEEDARRRDFTCNGLFFDPVAGRLHDFVGGQADIAAKRLRAIGDPAARFGEDHLRLLRAVRFAARLGFAVDDATAEAMGRLAGKIKTISKERVHDELARILGHPTRAAAVDLLHAAGLLRELWPAELQGPAAAGAPGAGRVARLGAGADFVVALAALQTDLSGGGGPAGAAVAEYVRRDLLLTNAETADLGWLVDQRRVLAGWEGLTRAPVKRLLADPRWPRLALLMHAEGWPAARAAAFDARAAAWAAEGAAPPPLITGQTLIRLGAAPGPTFKRWLDGLYDRQLEGEFATAAAAVAAAEALIRSGG
jgi:poly(A) polymerase